MNKKRLDEEEKGKGNMIVEKEREIGRKGEMEGRRKGMHKEREERKKEERESVSGGGRREEERKGLLT